MAFGSVLQLTQHNIGEDWEQRDAKLFRRQRRNRKAVGRIEKSVCGHVMSLRWITKDNEKKDEEERISKVTILLERTTNQRGTKKGSWANRLDYRLICSRKDLSTGRIILALRKNSNWGLCVCGHLA